MTPARLAQLLVYAEALALNAWAHERGSLKDLEDIAAAIEELLEIKHREELQALRRAA